MRRSGSGGCFFFLAGGLLIAQLVLFWLLEEPAWLSDAPRLRIGLQCAGWAVLALGAFLLTLPILVLRRKGSVAEGESYVETRVLVETGIYAVVRHPQYLGWMVMYSPLVLLMPHWPLALIGVLGAACVHRICRQEDRDLVDKFGVSYERYMLEVPGLDLLSGIGRLLARRTRT